MKCASCREKTWTFAAERARVRLCTDWQMEAASTCLLTHMNTNHDSTSRLSSSEFSEEGAMACSTARKTTAAVMTIEQLDDLLLLGSYHFVILSLCFGFLIYKEISSWLQLKSLLNYFFG